MPLLSPPPKFHVDTATGAPAVGWELWTYINGTSTPKVTYQDFGLASQNTNPIVLDARGEATIFLSGSYKFVLKDDVGATIWTVDEIRDLSTDQTFTNVILAGTLTINSTSVSWAGNPTHSGNHTFTGNVTINGNTAIGNIAADSLTIASDTITWTNGATHSGNHTFSGNVSIGGTFTLPTGAVLPNTYTPTLTNTTNVAASTARVCQYFRLGNMVLVSGGVDIDPTGAGATLLGISLPIASSFTTFEQLGGVAFNTGSGVEPGGMFADSTNDRASLNFTAVGTTNSSWSFIFLYRII